MTIATSVWGGMPRPGSRKRLMVSVLVWLAATPSPPAKAQAPTTRVPVLEFPELGLDDTARYRGYRTRIYRDVASNTLQIYLDQREARVVHLFANAENESIGFTARGADGEP